MVLHILLIILKIIGIIVAVILGLLLLLLVTFLCVPVRYRLDASMPGEIKESSAYGRVTWLLRLIRIDVSFEEQELKWRVRIAWKSFGSEPQKSGHTDTEKKKSEDRPVKTDIEKRETAKIESEKEEAHEKENTASKENRKEQRVESSSRLSEMEEESEEEKRTVESSKTLPENVEEIPESTPEKAGRFAKIKCTILKFCDKIKHTVGHAEEKLDSILDKKERIMKELEDPVHRKAFSKVKKEAGKLLKRWRPKVIKGEVQFGFEDPYHTGQALAGLSMIYPFIGDHLFVEPDFERRILKGKVRVRGGFRMMPLVCFLWNLVWCSEIRKTYHDIRKFQL